ncbi:MAG: hypothetical protein SNJ63_04800 [Sphingomonadaceae bacterium]
MAAEKTQEEKDRDIQAALDAYQGRDRRAPYAEQFRLWEALWEACDFSWKGLADCGTDRGGDANLAQRLKQWDWRPRSTSVQDYWRLGPAESSEGALGYPLLSDGQLLEMGLLVTVNGRLWHVAHRPETEVTHMDHPLAHAIAWRLNILQRMGAKNMLVQKNMLLQMQGFGREASTMAGGDAGAPTTAARSRSGRSWPNSKASTRFSCCFRSARISRTPPSESGSVSSRPGLARGRAFATQPSRRGSA